MPTLDTSIAELEIAMRRFRLFVKSFVGVSGGGGDPPTGGALTIDSIAITIDGAALTFN